MRFRGGGVGHMATRERTETMSQDADMNIPEENEEDFEEDDSESLDSGDAEQLDDEWSTDSDIEVGDSELEDEFEGEEPWGVDEYTAEGYAPP